MISQVYTAYDVNEVITITSPMSFKRIVLSPVYIILP